MFIENVKDLAKNNNNFRRVVFTGPHSQLVLMSLAPGEDIGEEVHPTIDQIFFIIEGEGKAVIEGQSSPIEKHSTIFVTAGTKHDIVNSGSDELKLCTIYSPPAHKDGAIHVTKEDAEKQEKSY